MVKSFQKYATLGSQKIGAENISVIGDKESPLVKKCLKTLHHEFDDLFDTEKKINCSSDLQWLTHLLKYNGEDEMRYFQVVQENTNKFYKVYKEQINCLKDAQKSFGMVLLPMDRTMYIDNFLKKDLPFATWMDSFGFHFTASSAYAEPFYNRMSIGLEPPYLIDQLAKLSSDINNPENNQSLVYNNHELYKFDRTYIIDLEKYIKNMLFPLLNREGENFKKAEQMLIKCLKKTIEADQVILETTKKGQKINYMNNLSDLTRNIRAKFILNSDYFCKNTKEHFQKRLELYQKIIRYLLNTPLENLIKCYIKDSELQ